MSASVFNSIIGTLMDVFPHVTVWYPTPHPAPLVLIAGSKQQQYFSPKYIEKELLNENIRNSLSKLNIQNDMDVLSCYIGDENDLRKAVSAFSVNSDYFPFVEFSTDVKLPKEQIFSEFVLRIRSDSINDHIDWTGLNKNEKEAWLANYQRLYEACGHLLMLDGTTNMLDKLKYSLAGLSIFPDKPAFLAARVSAEEKLFSAGVKMILSGETDQALVLSGEILKIHPQSAIAWMIRSSAMQHKGEMQQALTAAQQAVALAPDNPDVHSTLGIIWFGAGQFENAVTEYREALRLAGEASSSDKAKMLSALASAYAATGRFPEAIDAAETALGLALSAGQEDLAKSIRKQLLLFKEGTVGQKQH